jgi:hypothetical protein
MDPLFGVVFRLLSVIVYLFVYFNGQSEVYPSFIKIVEKNNRNGKDTGDDPESFPCHQISKLSCEQAL